MKFLKKSSRKAKKHVLVISDLHLGAGHTLKNGSRNLLEDFHSDEELVAFINYFSSGEFESAEVDLVINGDFLDLLAVPYVKYFDDEFWSESAAQEKLAMILKGHVEVMDALKDFVRQKNKKIVYIIGNHDAELYFDSLKQMFIEMFDPETRSRVILSNELNLYNPAKGIYIQHGHEYESAHSMHPDRNVVVSGKGEKYFIPPWGSYYVTHIINKYKQERKHLNEVTPIRSFMIHGLIFDSYFTVRFILANIYYFVMVRLMDFVQMKQGWRTLMANILKELTLFEDYEVLTRDFFKKHSDAKVLIVGHTHKPMLKEYLDGTTFINCGTWMRTVSLDLKQEFSDRPLTFAHVQVFEKEYELEDFARNVRVDLHRWAPRTELPYQSYI